MSPKDPNYYRLSFLSYAKGLLSVLFRLPAINRHIRQAQTIAVDDVRTIGGMLEENARNFADRPALMFEEESYSYGEFNARVNQYAHFFRALGVQYGDVVVVNVDNTPSTLFLVSALAKIGAIASLINSNQRDKVLIHSISLDMGKYFVIGEGRMADFQVIQKQLNLPTDAQLFWEKDLGEQECPEGFIDLQEEIESHSKENPERPSKLNASSRFANVFTSGTTGLPKAGIQTHRKWLYCYYWYGKANMNLNSRDVIYVSIPFYHTNALIVAWPSAMAGAAAVAMRRKFSSSNFWKDIRKFDASAFIYIGEICRYLMNMPTSSDDLQHRVRKIVGNGLRPDIWKAFKKRFGITKVFELYGASDGNVGFLNTLNIDNCVGWSKGDYVIVKYDLELEEAYRNADGFCEKVEVGHAGLLLGRISDFAPFAGYVHKEKNEAKILKDVFEPGDTWFISGDMIRDIGYKHAQFVDRLGDTFRWKGENVSTAELEEVVNALPSIEACAVYGVKVPHTDGKAGMASLKIYTKSEDFDFKGFASDLRQQLPSYAMPLFLRIVEGFETTSTHKIQKFNLKKMGIERMHAHDEIYVLLPKSEAYVKMDESIEEGIKRGDYAF